MLQTDRPPVMDAGEHVKGNAIPLWISHRGWQQNADENTLQAFQEARARGFTAFETDLRQTADSHIILVHDYNLKRLTGIDNLVGRLNRRALSSIKMKKGGRLLFLDQLLEAFTDCKVTLDIKPEQGETVIQNLIQFIHKNQLVHWFNTRVKLLTWKPSHESMLLQAFPGARFYARRKECLRAGFCALAGFPDLGGMIRGRTYAITPSLMGIPLFRKRFISRYRNRGALTVAYLPETQRQASKARLAGMDEILTESIIL